MPGKHYYPVFLNLQNRSCLVFGGGKIAERKIRRLLRAGARVVCISETFTEQLLKRRASGNLRLVARKLSKDLSLMTYLKGVFLVIAATDSSGLNRQIYKACSKKNILVNAVDHSRNCNFISPAVVRRGDLCVAISTGGASPQLAKTLRRKLENLLGPEYGHFLRLMARNRRKISNHIRSPKRRKTLFKGLVESKLLDLFKKGRFQSIRREYNAVLKRNRLNGAALNE